MIVAATGHRPQKLKNGFSALTSELLYHLASEYIEKHPEITKGISGMALGWDTAWARACLNNNIPLVAAVPFRGQEGKWFGRDVENYHRILDQADEVVYVSEGGYAAWKMQVRNEWMVDRCDRLVALWDGSKGGTGNCIQYAEKKNKPYDNLWNEYVQRR